MSISWLSHYTSAGDPAGFRDENERRAAALRARWHGFLELGDALVLGLARRARDARRARSARRELDRLDDDRLRDVGLRRTPDGQVVRLPADAWYGPRPRAARPHRPRQTGSRFSANALAPSAASSDP